MADYLINYQYLSSKSLDGFDKYKVSVVFVFVYFELVLIALIFVLSSSTFLQCTC